MPFLPRQLALQGAPPSPLPLASPTIATNLRPAMQQRTAENALQFGHSELIRLSVKVSRMMPVVGV